MVLVHGSDFDHLQIHELLYLCMMLINLFDKQLSDYFWPSVDKPNRAITTFSTFYSIIFKNKIFFV